MLDFADSFIDNGGPQTRRAAAAINSITVDTYRYARPAFYTPEVMASVIGIYNAAGWKHLGLNPPAGSQTGLFDSREANP